MQRGAAVACLLAVVLLHAPAIAAPSGPPFDFRTFETVHFPAWVDSFLVGNASRGDYSFLPEFDPWRAGATLYGVTDIVYARAITNTLNLTDAERDAWAETVLSFRNSTDDFFRTEWFEEVCGFEPYHAAGYANAALRLLERPASAAKWAEAIAELGSADAWNATFFPWLDPRKKYQPLQRGFWTTSHAVAAVPSVLLTTNQSSRFEGFFDWWHTWSASYQDPGTGYWVLNPAWRPPSMIGMGGSFHLFMIDAYRGEPWQYREHVLNTTAEFQGPDGLWDRGLQLTYGVDLDGVFSILRSAQTPSDFARGQAACTKYLASAQRILTSPVEVLAYRAYSHLLPGALAAIAECQKWFPALILTERPWVQTLDIAPYV